jgi:hypothetical protein
MNIPVLAAHSITVSYADKVRQMEADNRELIRRIGASR